MACRCGNDGWFINDGYGIPLAMVCDACETTVLSEFRPDILDHYDCDEAIAPD